MAIDLMDVQGVPALGSGTRAAYERVQAAWSGCRANGVPGRRGRGDRAAALRVVRQDD